MHIIAMKEEHHLASGGRVTQSYLKNSSTTLESGLDSFLIFGDNPRDIGNGASSSRRHTRGYIALNKPALNLVFTSHEYSILSKLLNMKSSVIKDIMSFREVLDPTTSELKSVKDVDTGDYVLYGPEVIEYLIEKVDIEHELFNMIEEYLGVNYHSLRIGDGEAKYRVIGDVYSTEEVNILDEDKRGLVLEGKLRGITRFQVLYHLRTKARARGFITKFVTVKPPELRPQVGDRKDPVMKYYNKLITRNDNLKIIADSGSPYEIVNAYRLFLKAYAELTVSADETNGTKVAAIDVLKGKYGHIRNKMVGKRVDHSGRSVITVDPTLSVDRCGLPDEIIGKIYLHHLLMRSKIEPEKILEMSMEMRSTLIEQLGILDEIPVMLNRAPTLHKLGYQAFWAKRVQGKAIKLHPLACQAYNADFDGDQMGVHVPISQEAIYEAINLMLTTHNLFKPADGSCTIVPRQEMVYGLNVLTKEYDLRSTSVYESKKDVYNLLYDRKLKVYDGVNIKGHVMSAGKAAFEHCLPRRMHGKYGLIGKKEVSKVIDDLLVETLPVLVQSVDLITKMSFRIAKHYSPNISLLTDIGDVLDAPFAAFEEEIAEAQMYYDYGFETEESYNIQFNEALSKTKQEVLDILPEAVGEDNGFLMMIQSGARGSMDNLVQIYSHKGQIQKADGSPFNTVIKNSFSDGLSPMEHFMSAYGTRKGLLDKSKGPADTGYMSRKLWHADEEAVIIVNDCGTEDGIRIDKHAIREFLIDSESLQDEEKVREVTVQVDKYFADIIRGRYFVKDDSIVLDTQANRMLRESEGYIDKHVAEYLASSESILAIRIRSVLTCSEPYCAKCYGDDLSSRGNSVPGTAIGFMAAQSVSEIGTQLTMRTFQKGGVSGGADVTSSFKRISLMFDMADLKEHINIFPDYDPIAWATGKVTTTTLENEDYRSVTIEGSNRKGKVSKYVEVKDYVERGEGLLIVKGQHDPNELLHYRDLRTAQLSWLYSLFTVYNGSSSINMKHFEVILSALTKHVVYDSEYRQIKLGRAYGAVELRDYDHSAIQSIPALVGILKAVKAKNNFLSKVIMEDLREGLKESYLYNLDTTTITPLGEIAVGKRPKVGTYYPGYVENRLREERTRL